MIRATMLNFPEEGRQVSPTEEIDEHLKGVFAIPEGRGHFTGGAGVDDEGPKGLVPPMVCLALSGPEEELPTFAHAVP